MITASFFSEFWQHLVDHDEQGLFLVLAGFILSFALIRMSTRLMRSPRAPWWPGSVVSGGVHLHHLVFGIVTMMIAGILGFATLGHSPYAEICAFAFGVGAGLTIDEFALWVHLDDVYWAEEGRLSVDAVAIATGISGLLLLGGVPLLNDLTPFEGESALAFGLTIAAVIAIDLALAAVTLLKGKLWTGLVGLFVPLLLIIGAIRLARPASVWSRRRYQARDGRPGRPDKLARAQRREERYREPVHRLKVLVQDAVAGAPTRPVEAGPNPVSGVAEDQHRPG
jgi:hypothetical protein